jgi:hypothetical protein
LKKSSAISISPVVRFSLNRGPRSLYQVLVVSTLVSMVLGLLPMIDNWAHLGGFICGLLTSLLVIPKLTMPPNNLFQRRLWKTKIILRMVAAALCLVAYFVVTLCTSCLPLKQGNCLKLTTITLSATADLIMSRLDAEQWCKPCEYISCLPIFEECRFMLGWTSPEAPSANYTIPISAAPH